MFRKAQPSDIARIAEIQTSAWHAAYASLLSEEVMKRHSLDAFLELWEKRFEAGDHSVHLFVDEADQVCGFCRTCRAKQVPDALSDYGELTHLYLDPEKTAKGYGHRLFIFALNSLKDKGYEGMVLWTLEHNDRARRFYEKHGMHADGARRDDPESLGIGVYEVRYVLPFDT